jgi:Carboxypeptidase regulatory-like domain/TonB dependent receptor
MMHHSTKAGKYFLVALFVSLVAGPVHAQSTVDGAIGGTVYDTANNLVGSASVDVLNQATDADSKAQTDKAGYFRAQHLQPGVYTVTITMPGFATYTVHDVLVEIGNLTELAPAPHLTIGNVSQNVTVTDDEPAIDTTSPAISTVVEQHTIDNLPINGRRWTDFTLLTPGVVANSAGYGLVSFRGVSVLLNNNTIDGADNNQAYFSEARGRTRAGYSTTQASIQEYQVNTANYSAEYGRSAGGVVNVVTKSGSNSLHGELYFYDRDNNWGALNPFNTLTTQVPGTNNFVTTVYNPKDWRKIWGFAVGGPLIKDKLFFFYAYDQFRRNFPATAKVGSPATFFATPDPNTPFTAGGAPTTCTATGAAAPNTLDGQVCVMQKRLNYVNYQYAAAQYVSGLQQIANGDLGMVPRTGNQAINFPKLDWQINSKNHVSFEYNRFRWDGPGAIQQTTSADVGQNDYGNDFVKIDWGIARLVTVLTNSMTNELRYQYGRELDDEYANHPNAYESQIANSFGVAPRIVLDGSTGVDLGNPEYLDRAAYPDERRNQVADTVNWSKGNHAIKFGVDFNHVNDLSNNLQYQKGSYEYPFIYNYLTDYYEAISGNPHGTCSSNRTSTGTDECYSSYTQGYGPLAWDFSTNDYDFFAQDDWRVNPKLTLSLGVRYEYEQLPKSPSITSLAMGSAPTVNAGFMPSDKNNIGPRAGFAYNVFANAKTVLRGGYGIYNGRIINSTIFQAYAFNGNQPGIASQTSFVFTDSSGVLFPSTAPLNSGTPSTYYFNPHFQAPQIHQFDLILEQQMGWNTVLSVGYLASLGRELPGFVDQNINTAVTNTVTYTITPSVSGNYGPLGTTPYTSVLYGTKNNNTLGKVTDIFSGVNSNYQAMVVQLTHRMSHNLQFYASYNWAHALDNNQNESTFADANDQYDPRSNKYDYANSIYDIPNRVVANAIYTTPAVFHGAWALPLNGWGISPLLQMQDGLPYSGLTTGTPSGGLYGSINGSGGTTTIGGRGLPGTGRNTFRLPTKVQTDLRVWKDFQIERCRLELLGELFNVANHLNITQQNTTEYVISGNTLTYQDAFGTNQNANSNSIYTPRQVEIGARLKF